MTYEEYMSSGEWAAKRQQRLAMDGHRCRMCDETGENYRLEVHHRPGSYKSIPNESVQDDLTTLCARCHEEITNIIRGDRYEARTLAATVIESKVTIRQEISYGMANSEVQINLYVPAHDAQRAIGEPAQQVGKVDEADFIQARQDRR